jgi:predicted ATPase
MAAAVERHIVLLNTAITANGGVLFKVVGDAVQACFSTAPQGVAAAFDGQRALLAADWTAVGGLSVRMALHAGEAEPDGRGDYLAAPLNRLSRLLATGYGGQILLSQTVQQLTRGALPAGSHLRDLGEHRLRDLLEPERVFQLLHPDLPESFPPLKTLDSRPGNLPRQPTPCVGRESQLRDIVSLLQREDVQLLTLTGPGGTGKTRLALQVAADLLDDFRDGVYFVPLAALTDPALVPSAIAQALGLRHEGEQPMERLGRLLATKAILLVLDNVEHLVEAAPMVGSLLGDATGLKVLATSRVPLRLRAERECPVPPLGLPPRQPPLTLDQLSQYEAVRLFTDRAQAVKPDFALDDANAPVVAEICHRLDGLPLAIELAAARVRLLPPVALLERLEQRLPLLTGGARDAPERQRTLRKTIAWSYDLLDPEEQRTFHRLAVFAGGCTLEAAEAVGNHDGALDAFSRLEDLCAHSLLRQEGADGNPRFTMLESIREFGLEHLAASGEESAVRDAHSAFFRVLGEHAARDFAERRTAWFAQLMAEADNLRAALTWDGRQNVGEEGLALAIALANLAFQRGGYVEARRWLTHVLATTGPPSTLRATALACLAAVASGLGDFTAALSVANAGEEMARAVGSDLDVGSAQYAKATVLVDMQKWDEAEQRLMAALACGQRHIPEDGAVAAVLAADCHNVLGVIAVHREDYDTAARHYEEALRIVDVGGVEHTIPCLMLYNLAEAEYGRGRTARAAHLLTQAMPLMWEAGDLWLVAGGLQLTAWCASAAGRHVDAARLLGVEHEVIQPFGIVEEPNAVADREQLITRLRAGLGSQAFRDAWEAGRRLLVEEGVHQAETLASELATASPAVDSPRSASQSP